MILKEAALPMHPTAVLLMAENSVLTSSLTCASAEQAIRLFGTDFSLMEKMFPGRQRKALKFKLRREYKDNPERIDAALSGKGCDASSYQDVVTALQKVCGQSLFWTQSKVEYESSQRPEIA